MINPELFPDVLDCQHNLITDDDIVRLMEERIHYYLNQMVDQNAITQAEADAWEQELLT